MYSNFDYYAPTHVVFGKDTENQTGALVKAHGGTKVLLHFGGQSAIRSGLLGRVKASLEAEGIPYVELGGAVPNPVVEKVYEGIELGRKEGVDFILAVGGGSVIDSAKAIGLGLANEGDVWDYFEHIREAKQMMPVGCVLTIAAAGSEMSNDSVVSNLAKGEKRGYGRAFMHCTFAVMNPELTMTLPAYQTFAGLSDIMMHTMERYFHLNDPIELNDAIAEGLLRTVMGAAKVLQENPNDYNVRADVMWAGSLSHNGLTGCGTDGGDWSSHNIEHELGAMFNVTHGAGLTAVWGSWARYTYKYGKHRFVRLGKNVLGVEPGADDDETCLKTIAAMESFFSSIGMPITLKELGVEPTDQQTERMAEGVMMATGGGIGALKRLDKQDIINILNAAK